MLKYSDQYLSKYKSVELFDMVIDVSSYPEFIPWISKVKILKKGHAYFEAELLIEFKLFVIKYVSRVDFIRPDTENNNGSIVVSLIRGPFKFLKNEWAFATASNGTVIDFNVEFAFKSTIMEKAMQPIFIKNAKNITQIFEDRANALYG